MSRKAWAGVFPPDREAVFKRAALLARQGFKPDEAIRMASDDVADATLTDGSTNLSKAVLRLLPAFGAAGRDEHGRVTLEVISLAEKAIRGVADPDVLHLSEEIRCDVSVAFSAAAREAESAKSWRPSAEDERLTTEFGGRAPDPDDPSTYMDGTDLPDPDDPSTYLDCPA